MLIFFQNPYAIVAHTLQHYHDFQSNVAIFHSVVQAFTQPYSFSGSIKLIISQIGHELSLIIHEISTIKQQQFAVTFLYNSTTYTITIVQLIFIMEDL